MKLLFLYGLPATGKLTVAQELARMTGFKLFHNHLTVDLLLSLFDFGSPAFVELREEIWLSAFTQAARTGIPGLIFTFAPEATVRPQFVPNLLKAARNEAFEIDFIELTCPLPELKRRLDNPSRGQFKKLTSLDLFDQLHAAGSLDAAHMPTPRLTIDTSSRTPSEAATEIMQSLSHVPAEAAFAL